MKYFLAALVTGLALLSHSEPLAARQSQGSMQQQMGTQSNGQNLGGLNAGINKQLIYSTVEVDVKGPNGAPVEGAVYVSLIKLDGQVVMTTLAKGGKASFGNVPRTELTAQVVAPGYETTKKSFNLGDGLGVTLRIDLQPMSDREAAASDKAIAALSPKAQKNVGKALEDLHANKFNDARNYLEAAQREAPKNAEVEYLFGVCASRANDIAQAQQHWMKALELDPNHLSALLAVSQLSLQDRKAAEALPYLQRALEVDPSSWRAHMLMAQADLFQSQFADAAKQAGRAIDLGHERAEAAQPLLAHALYESGEKDRAIEILKKYVAAHPSDTADSSMLQEMENPQASAPSNESASTPGNLTVLAAAAVPLPLPSNWLPPDVDEKIPPVEQGVSCSLNEVLQKAGDRVVELVHDVDRFAATETLTHELINKYGIASPPEKRKFDYVVSMEEIRPGYLGVTEYRNGGAAQQDFPDGFVTNGLPALVLILHPYYQPNYEMTCEGLARTSEGLAWQVHFRQRSDKPKSNKSFRLGINGPSYPVGLKGRAWISVSSYELLRMETDLVAPLPEIRLVAEHTTVEYGPVKFHKENVNLWLPQSAEVYFAWRGRQVHRRHSFSNYMLFGVEERQRIGTPKDADPSADVRTNSPDQP